MSRFDLNADLGEGEAASHTNALMRCIDSANVACGGHAGEVDSMRQAVRAARRHRVRLGAHPGWWSRGGDFGRVAIPLGAAELSMLLLHQVSALDHLARSEGTRLHHIKLHGALYHLTESNPGLARAYVESVRRWWPRVKIYAMARGRVARLARARGVEVWEEAFLDRAYEPDGRLVSRRRRGAVLTRAATVLRRLDMLLESGVVEAVDGTLLALHPRTLCLHSDTPGAARLARAVARALGGQGG